MSRFQELSSILEPGRTSKTDKAIILSDCIRMVNQLREEARKLKDSHDILQDKMNELKVCSLKISSASCLGIKLDDCNLF